MSVNSKLFICDGAIPTHLALSIKTFFTIELVGTLKYTTVKLLASSLVIPLAFNNVTLKNLAFTGNLILLY